MVEKMAEFKLGLSGLINKNSESNDNKLNIINFINEVSPKNSDKYAIMSAIGIYLVTAGSAKLNMVQESFSIKYGDIFFTFPTKSYYISDMNNFQYMCVTFFGGQAEKLLEKSRISSDSPIITGKEKLIPLWKECHQMQNGENTDLLAKSVIYMSFANIDVDNAVPVSEKSSMDAIKSYINTHFNDPGLSLQGVSELFDYNFHYVSRSFKEKMGCTFSEYLTSVRIQKACGLMKEGLTNVSNIAYFVGYSDPLYFSRVFSSKIGTSPKQYIQSLGKK